LGNILKKSGAGGIAMYLNRTHQAKYFMDEIWSTHTRNKQGCLSYRVC